METIEDIVREMRDLGRLDEKSTDKIPRSLQALGLRTYADRIKVAHQRELEDAIADTIVAAGKSASEVYEPHIQSEPVGNAAKTREALVIFVHDFASFRSNVEHGIVTMTQCMDFVKKYIPLMEAALSAPPRNCDLFGGDNNMLHTAWFDWTASPSGMNDDGTIKLTYGEWLLERAKGGKHCLAMDVAEAKGEDDEQ